MLQTFLYNVILQTVQIMTIVIYAHDPYFNIKISWIVTYQEPLQRHEDERFKNFINECGY